MKRLTTLCVTLLLATGLSTPVLANNPVYQDMKAMNKEYKTATHADTAADLKATLLKLRDYTVQAQNQVPPDFKDQPADGPERQAYVTGMNTLLTQIDQAIRLCDAGQLDEAQAMLDEINRTRRSYHKKLHV